MKIVDSSGTTILSDLYDLEGQSLSLEDNERYFLYLCDSDCLDFLSIYVDGLAVKRKDLTESRPKCISFRTGINSEVVLDFRRNGCLV